LVRYTYSFNRVVTTDDDDFVQTYGVLEHRQIANGVWYPVHCTYTAKYSKEAATWFRAREQRNDDQNKADGYSPRKSELILSKIALLDDKAAEPDLTVKLPDDLDIHTEE
jgi:hypothetical protein